MEEKVIPLNQSNIHALRSNVEKRLLQSDMRRKIIGGVSEEDVYAYVETIRQQFRLVEEDLKRQVRELQLSKDELQRDYEAYRQRSLEKKPGFRQP